MNEKESSPDEKYNIRIHNMLASIKRTFLPVDSTIGKYKIIEEIDRGGMAVVYKATQLDLDRVVALKVMPANISINRGFVERFLTEAHAVAKLNHPNIVKIYEIATENNIYYLSMEYIPGKNLYYYLHYQKPKLVDVLEIVVRLTEALAYAHNQKIIHRDLKLNNVIMRDHLSPVLIDFGLAKAMENDDAVQPGITRTGEIIGSPSYMAPERLLGGTVDHRSDICSLGIMLYEMLTFKNPYLDQRNLHQTTINVMESNPIPPRRLVPWLPVEIEAITLKAMAKEPANRYQTMEEFKADIVRYQHGDPVIARPPSLYGKVRHYVKRHWAPIAIGMIVFAFSALFITMFYLQNKKEQSHWQLIYNETFENKECINNWLFHNESLSTGNREWVIEDGVLKGKSQQRIFALINKHFNRDILIECTIKGNPKDIYNAGIFFSGDQPDSSYCFYINKNGTGDHGMTMKGSSFLLRDQGQMKVPLFNSNKVIIERIQDFITFTINGCVVTRIYDNLPVLGKGHDKVGMFLENGSAQFDNVKIYRRAIPQVPSPTLIADRFWERGDFEAALDEYRGLLMDFASNDISKEIKIKMADCLFRLKDYGAANRVIESCSLSTVGRDEQIIPKLQFLKAMVFANQGSSLTADSILKKLAENYPLSNVNQATMNSIILRSAEYLKKNRPDLAMNDLKVITTLYRKNISKTIYLYDDLLNYYVQRRLFDSATAVAQSMIGNTPKNDQVIALARMRLATLYLYKGKKDSAKVVLDQIITANANSDQLWEALVTMAEVNEYEFKYKDAEILYNKVYREGPQSSLYTWMSGIALGIQLQTDSLKSAQNMFADISEGNHPFPAPRLIANLFLNKISNTTFESEWLSLFPQNQWYLYYIARKYHVEGNDKQAIEFLQKLKESLSKKEWNYFRVIRVLNNFNRW